MADTIRVGIVGAGANTRSKHIPGLRAVPDVEIVGVVNRTPESTAKAVEELGIPQGFASWRELVHSPDIDAVVVGTWPNLHRDVTCAALEAGKHVLTEARMARNVAEAREMLAVSRAHPELVAQIVPSPFGLESGPMLEELLKNHYLGDLREVVVLGANEQFWDYTKPLHWRQDTEISGRNILALGILQETLQRWVPQPEKVFAQTEIFEPSWPVPGENEFRNATIPDSVQIITEFKGGSRGMYHISGVIQFGPGLQIHMYGSRGTIKVEFGDEERVYVGRIGDDELKRLEIPEEQRGGWNVEADFIQSIREQKPATLTDFETGVAYMEFLEAVWLSAERNAPVELPLS